MWHVPCGPPCPPGVPTADHDKETPCPNAAEPFFASDYFEQLYAWAEELISTGKAYVDDLTGEQIREHLFAIAELKLRWGVSKAAIIFRARQLGS